MSRVRGVTDEELESLLMKERGVFAVAFMAYMSIPCEHFLPELRALSELMNGRLSFYSIDVDENPTITGELGVTVAPTLLVIKDGKEYARYEGPYSREAMKDRIDTLLLLQKPDVQS